MGSGQSINGYTKLHHSSNSLKQPLLGHDQECMEQEHVIEQNKKKNEALEKEIRELKFTVSKFESKMQSNVSEPPPPKSKALAIKEQKADTALETEVKELKHRVAKLEARCAVYPLMKKHEEAIESMRKKNAHLLKKIEELTTTVYQMNAVEPKSEPEITSPPAPEITSPPAPEITSPYMNDLLGCLVVLIFLVSILIGVNLCHR